MSATRTKVQSIIDENPVAVFSKSYCPYCRAAKQLLSENGAKFFAIELDQVGMCTHKDSHNAPETARLMQAQTTAPPSSPPSPS